jgi:A/G-specific adenine glycosylase
MPSQKTAKAIRSSLLKWFRLEKRQMPWRDTRDPYLIWVSEIMLQQTQVKTVIPYFNRWIKALPTVKKLACAQQARVLKLWEGLGYYSRARNLHRAAKIIVSEKEGKIPDTLEEIRKLPGIGRYTAGAILSIAYHRRVPVLDGNVKRVLARLFRLHENGAGSKSENKLWDVAEQLVPKSKPGDFNEALMELGATRCLPKKPLCLLCPVQSICESCKTGEQERFPPPRKRLPAKKIEVSAAVILRRNKTFIQQRLFDGMMGGLWEFPGGKLQPDETPEEGLLREIREELGVDVVIREKLMTIKHTYTQFRITLHVFRCVIKKGRIHATQCEQWKWVHLKDLKGYPFPAANIKIVEHLAQGNSTRPPGK